MGLFVAGRDFKNLLDGHDQGCFWSIGGEGLQLQSEPIKVGPFGLSDPDLSKDDVICITAGFYAQGVMHLTEYQNGKQVNTATSDNITKGIMFQNEVLGATNVLRIDSQAFNQAPDADGDHLAILIRRPTFCVAGEKFSQYLVVVSAQSRKTGPFLQLRSQMNSKEPNASMPHQ